MKIDEFARQFPDRMKRLEEFPDSKDAKLIMKNEAIEHFRESFANEGFTDETLEKWPEVERRKPESDWYGHRSKRVKGQSSFSAARTTAKILTGESNDLGNAFDYIPIKNGVRIINDRPYAAVHQYGRMAKIYGKKAFKMTARPFVGKSKVMVRNIKDILSSEMIKIIRGE